MTASASVERRAILLDALAIGATTGAYGISFGAIAIAGGLSLLQAAVLSLAMFTGASQFAFVAVLAAGGAGASAAATAGLLGMRNAFYGVQLSRAIRPRGWRRLVAAQLVIDESAAMSLGRSSSQTTRFAFWASGLSVFVLWNLGTLIGALGAAAIPDPAAWGLDMAAPAAFVALIAPRMRGRRPWVMAAGAAIVALSVSPWVPAGVPILIAGAYALLAGALLTRRPLRRAAR